jgi:drug/metabolite transporter (DMT)-like permease
MTAQFLDHRAAAPADPTAPLPRHLVAGGLIGAVAAVSFSVAVGSFVVGSTHRLQPATATVASSLVAAVPLFVIAGLVHLVLAAALLLGGRRVRMPAVALAALAAIVAIGSAAMLLTGLDPFGGPRAGHPTTQGVAVLLLAAAAYGIAALLANPASAEHGDS